MNKRGQMFVVIAFIICFILFTVITPYNTVKETVALQDFNELTENYKNEEPKVINKAIAEGKNQGDTNAAVTEFTTEFIKFAKTKDPKFGIVYVVKDAEGNYIIKNYLNEQLVKVTAKAAGTQAPEVTVSSGDQENDGNIALEGLGEIGARARADAFDPNTNTVNLGKLGGYDKIKIIINSDTYEFTINELENNAWIIRTKAECPPEEAEFCDQKTACNENTPCF